MLKYEGSDWNSEGVSTVRVDGPYGKFEIDALKPVVDGKALDQAGLEPTKMFHGSMLKNLVKPLKRLCTEEEWLSACTGVVAKDANGDGIYSDDMKNENSWK